MLKPHSQIEMEQHWTIVVVFANFNKLENLDMSHLDQSHSNNSQFFCQTKC
jgi:hypothetical protein